MTTDLLATALVQLVTLMAANWTLVEMSSPKLRLGKFWRSLVSGPILSMVAYGLGWFNALPAMAADAVPIAGFRGYLSAAFAGFIASILTSGAHKVLIGAKSAPPPPPPLDKPDPGR